MSKLSDILIGRYEDATKELQDIHDRAAEDDGRELTDEEHKRAEELTESIESLDKRIEQVRSQEEQIAKQHERSRPLPPRRDEEDPTRVQVRSEPSVYGEGSPHNFLTDLLIRSAPQLNLDIRREDAVHDRMARHIEETKDKHTHRRAVNSGNLVGIVNPMFDPATIARGIYDGAVTKSLLRQYPLPAEGDSVTVPRVTTKATAGVQGNEGSNFHEASLVTAAVKFDVFTIALRLPVSIQAIERGTMSMELMEDEIVRAWMEECNHMCLYGDNANNEPIGILYQNAANPLTYNEFDGASPTVTLLLDQITDQQGALGEARHRSPNAIITGVATWAAIRKGRDSDGRRLLSAEERTGRNVDGIGRVVAEDPTQIMSAGRLDNVDVFTDPAIPKTFTDTGATTGGSQSRIILMHRESMLWMDDGPSTFSYEQSLAASGQVLLVVRGYAAFHPGWYPSGCRVIYGTRTVI